MSSVVTNAEVASVVETIIKSANYDALTSALPFSIFATMSAPCSNCSGSSASKFRCTSACGVHREAVHFLYRVDKVTGMLACGIAPGDHPGRICDRARHFIMLQHHNEDVILRAAKLLQQHEFDKGNALCCNMAPAGTGRMNKGDKAIYGEALYTLAIAVYNYPQPGQEPPRKEAKPITDSFNAK